MIQLKRVYDKAAPEDGTRFLVERLWPRGIKKSALGIDAWLKSLGQALLCGNGSGMTRRDGTNSAVGTFRSSRKTSGPANRSREPLHGGGSRLSTVRMTRNTTTLWR
jgi:Protein of unknown function, DUF488